jgi:hypothetical protein
MPAWSDIDNYIASMIRGCINDLKSERDIAGIAYSQGMIKAYENLMGHIKITIQKGEATK